MNADRKLRNKWSLTNETLLQCRGADAAADADVNAVPIISAGCKLPASESMTRY